MLRASVEATGVQLDPTAITDRSRDPLLPGGEALLDLVDAVLAGDDEARERARRDVRNQLGDDGLVDAAGVIGNFEMMNRVADATGMPVGKGSLARSEEWRARLGLDRYRHE